MTARYVTTSTGARVKIYPDGRTMNGFLPEDAWKQARLDRELRFAALSPDLARARPLARIKLEVPS